MTTGFRLAIATLGPCKENGALDLDALEAYAKFLNEHGVEEVVFAGTTMGFASHTPETRLDALKEFSKHFGGKIIFNVSSTDLDTVEYLMKGTENFASEFILLPPYYDSGATVEGLVAFFTRAIEMSTKNVFLYDFPQHTGVKTMLEVMKGLAAKRLDRFVGVKISGSSFEYSERVKEALPWCAVMVGGDPQMVDAAKADFTGSIMGGTGVFPELLVATTAAIDAKNWALAEQYQALIDEWCGFLGTIGDQHGYNEKATNMVVLARRVPGVTQFCASPIDTIMDPEVISKIQQKVDEIIRKFTAIS